MTTMVTYKDVLNTLALQVENCLQGGGGLICLITSPADGRIQIGRQQLFSSDITGEGGLVPQHVQQTVFSGMITTVLAEFVDLVSRWQGTPEEYVRIRDEFIETIKPFLDKYFPGHQIVVANPEDASSVLCNDPAMTGAAIQ